MPGAVVLLLFFGVMYVLSKKEDKAAEDKKVDVIPQPKEREAPVGEADQMTKAVNAFANLFGEIKGVIDGATDRFKN